VITRNVVFGCIGIWLLVVCISFIVLRAIRTFKNDLGWPWCDGRNDDDPISFLIWVWPVIVCGAIPVLILFVIQESVTFCGTMLGKLLIVIFRKEKK